MQQQEAYPVRFTVDYPDRPLDRLTTGFRIFVAIPILIVVGTVSGGESWQWSNQTTETATIGAGGLLFLGPLLMILFRQKYPRWWFGCCRSSTPSFLPRTRSQPRSGWGWPQRSGRRWSADPGADRGSRL